MLKLNLKTEDHWLELDKGVRVKVRPFDTLTMLLAQRDATNRLKGNNADDPQRFSAQIQVALTNALAIEAIVDWEGVYTADGSAKAEITADTVEQLMSVWYIGQAFFEKYTSSLDVMHTEGNGSGSAANGISAAGQATVGDATNKNSHAPKPAKGKNFAPTSKTNP